MDGPQFIHTRIERLLSFFLIIIEKPAMNKHALALCGHKL